MYRHGASRARTDAAEKELVKSYMAIPINKQLYRAYAK